MELLQKYEMAHILAEDVLLFETHLLSLNAMLCTLPSFPRVWSPSGNNPSGLPHIDVEVLL